MTGEEARHRAELRDLIAQAEITVTDPEFEALVASRARLWERHDQLVDLHRAGAIDRDEFNRRDQALDERAIQACTAVLGAARCDRLFQRVPTPFDGAGPDRSPPPRRGLWGWLDALLRRFSHA